MSERKLTKRQQKFVEAMADPNTRSNADAARIAGYSQKTAREIAGENLTKPHIHDAIEKRKASLAKLAGVADREVLGATVAIAFSSIEDALDDHGHLDLAKAKRTGSAALIKRISRNPTRYGEAVNVEFYSKDAALARLADYLGMKQQNRKNENDTETVAKKVVERLVIEFGWSQALAVEHVSALYGLPW